VKETVLAAVRGGATVVQLRDPDATTRDLVVEARALVGLLRPHSVPLIVNDRVDVALAADADGVHVGQSDMDASDARALIGQDRILGLSITEEADLDRSDLTMVDYLGVGPVFATPTKADAAPPMGMAGLKRIATRTGLPIVAIGGLHAGNAADALAAGAQGVSVVSAICAAPDPEAATRELAEIVRAARAGR
jgi:thiamine-phosphate pyrophosphorylase